MAADVLGRGMHDDVRAVLERAAKEGRGERVVDDERQVVAVRDAKGQIAKLKGTMLGATQDYVRGKK